MAINSKYLTIRDIANQKDPDGTGIALVAETMSTTSSILDDAPAKQCNKADTHQGTVRTYLPKGSFVGYNDATPVDKAGLTKLTDVTGILSSASVVEKHTAELGGMDKVGAVRMAEANAHMEGMGQTLQEYAFYGNVVINPDSFTGLTPRYNSLSEDNARQHQQIIDCGGTGVDNASVWFVAWHPDNCHLIYPEGDNVGINKEDFGLSAETITEGGAEKVKRSYKTVFDAKIGIHIKDYRHAVRLCNIDVSDLTGSSPSLDLVRKFNDAIIKMGRVTSKGGSRLFVYMNETVLSAFQNQLENHKNMNLTWETMENGRIVGKFKNITIHQEDALINAEERVV